MPVSLTENARTLRARFRTSWSSLQPPSACAIESDDLAALGELEGVREQVLEDLLEALGVRRERARQRPVELDP